MNAAEAIRELEKLYGDEAEVYTRLRSRITTGTDGLSKLMRSELGRLEQKYDRRLTAIDTAINALRGKRVR